MTKKKLTSPLISVKIKKIDHSNNLRSHSKSVKCRSLQTSSMVPDKYYKPISSLCITH